MRNHDNGRKWPKQMHSCVHLVASYYGAALESGSAAMQDFGIDG